jgi:hypothetical protein
MTRFFTTAFDTTVHIYANERTRAKVRAARCQKAALVLPEGRHHPIQICENQCAVMLPHKDCVYDVRRQQCEVKQAAKIAAVDFFCSRHFGDGAVDTLVQHALVAKRPRQRLYQRRIGACGDLRHAIRHRRNHRLAPRPPTDRQRHSDRDAGGRGPTAASTNSCRGDGPHPTSAKRQAQPPRVPSPRLPSFADTLTGSAVANALDGGDGNDILIGGAGGDRLDGGAGVDMATWFGSNGAVQVDLASMTVSGGHAAGDVLVGIENLRGTAYADRLTGDGAANRIEGQFGDDVILGGAGDDILLGEGGSDRLTGGAGRDSMRGGTGADHFIYARILDLSTVQVMIDVIEDFRSAERDLIDLAAIDANPVLAGDQALQFVGTAGLTAIG